MRESIDGASFAQAMIHAAASLNLQKQQINELNVFPVPDGDTGTNMSLTLGTAAAELRKKQPHTVGEAAATNASGRPGQLRRHSVPALPRLCQGGQGQGQHRRPRSGHRPGLRRGRRL